MSAYEDASDLADAAIQYSEDFESAIEYIDNVADGTSGVEDEGLQTGVTEADCEIAKDYVLEHDENGGQYDGGQR